jgi:L-iditol 2-dehydrogenase
MRAVRAFGGEVRVVEVPAPDQDGVRVHVRSVGICGSDLHLVQLGFSEETTLGHEISGVTDDGTPVAVEPVISCGSCAYCERGDNPLCANVTANTMGIGLDGGMADQIMVPEHLVVPLPDGVAVADANLVEPLAVAVRAVARAGVTESSRVAVIGGGSIGLSTLAVARAWGATVELVARHDHQRSAGERLGAVEPTDQRAEIVFDAAGTSSSLASAIDKCEPGGLVAIPASYWDTVELTGMAMCLKEIRLVPSSMYGATTGPRDVTVAADIMGRNPEIARALITHRFSLDDAPDAFATAADRQAGSIKVVIEP